MPLIPRTPSNAAGKTRVSDANFKKEELERLLSENRIAIEQYLEAKAKLANQIPSKNQYLYRPKTKSTQEKSKKPIATAASILGLIIVSIAAAGWIAKTTNVSFGSSENLIVAGYDCSLLASDGELSFQVENSGTARIYISDVRITVYSNQIPVSISNESYIYDGTLSLEPSSKGSITLNFDSTSNATLAALSQFASELDEKDVPTVYSILNSYVFKFTFVTSANREYNYEITGLLSKILPERETTIVFTETSSITVANVAFNSTGDTVTHSITLALKNNGTETVTIAQVRVNDNLMLATDPELPLSIAIDDTKTLVIPHNVILGNTYQIDLFDGSNKVVGSTEQNASSG